MPITPATPNPKLFKLIGAFMGQAIAGIHIALYKAMQIELDNHAMNSKKMLLLAKYLNDCWETLVRGTDPFIHDHIAAMIAIIPDESPKCLFHLFFKLGTHAIENVNPLELCGKIPISKQRRVSSNPDYISYLETVATARITKECERVAAMFFRQRGEHLCTAPQWSAIHEQNPRPLWVLNKVNPTVIVFNDGVAASADNVAAAATTTPAAPNSSPK